MPIRTSLTTRYKAEVAERIAKMNNRDLIEATLEAHAPDDYDGCFTQRGDYVRVEYRNELFKRLTESGFVSPT